jgi:hypothetical protein
MKLKLLFAVVLIAIISSTAYGLDCDSDWDCTQGVACNAGVCDYSGEQIFHCGKPGCPAGEACVDQDDNLSICTGSGSFCAVHWDCPQGEFCYKGNCLRDARQEVYHCGKPGCPPGRWCLDQENNKSTCAEDRTYTCTTACDCGPAHACIDIRGVGKRCVKDVNDPWRPGGEAIFEATIPPEEPTYCCSAPECHTGRAAYRSDQSGENGRSVEEFRCFIQESGTASNFCGGSQCYYVGDCESGQTCVDTASTSSVPGTSCSRDGGRCVPNAIAEGVFGWSYGQLLLPCKKDGEWNCEPGAKCSAGWTPGGTYDVQRLVRTCPHPSPGEASCGNDTCDIGESSVTCPQDCRCGDGICGTEEVGVCLDDCGICGDGVCNNTQIDSEHCPQGNCFANETSKNCPEDCEAVCGDNSCSESEVLNCPEDCGCPDSVSSADYPARCGDGVCQTGGDIPEDCRYYEDANEYIVPCSLDCPALVDSDDDGVPDGCDKCPQDSAKTEPGECGCGVAEDDSDGDGILDCIDTCPLDAQNDSDSDGICGDIDPCPNSASSSTVVIQGCDAAVQNMFIVEGCNITDRIDGCAIGAENHGQFVSCISKFLKALKLNSVISGKDEGRIQRCAAKSDIP